MKNMPSRLREAATVILTSLKTAKTKTLYDYDLLSIKRSARNTFMPGTYVFPGGISHSADGSKKWLDIFSKCNMKLPTQSDNAATPPLLRNNNGDIPKIITLKITAIRETFEETGILLCGKGILSTEPDLYVKSLFSEELHPWRSKVEKDASEFLNLCEHFNCYPDINGLHLWSNWLTPKNNKKRFDTLFFMAALTAKPETLADKTEIDNVMWAEPKKILELNEDDIILLPPPQLYETSRLVNFTRLGDLVDFAKKRASQGCERWMPECIKALDGVVSLLPGDDAYKVDTYDGTNIPATIIEMSKDEFKCKCKVLHRFEGKQIIVKNYNPKHGHKLPHVS